MKEEENLEIIWIAARNIMKVKGSSKMNVYVVVSLTAGPKMMELQTVETPVDGEGGVNPTWNFPVTLRVAEFLAQENPLYVVFKLKCEEGSLGGEDVGEVNVPVKDMLDEYYKIKAATHHDKPPLSFFGYPVTTPWGNPQGELYFSYKFTGEIPNAALLHQQPVSSCPAVPPVGPSSSTSAPPYNYHATVYPFPHYPPPPPPPRPRRRSRLPVSLLLRAGELLTGGLIAAAGGTYDAGDDDAGSDDGGGYDAGFSF